MRYVQPYGEVDIDAPYINGDPSIGRMGSIPPAEAFEHPMRELVAIIERSMSVPDEEDLEQVAKSVRSQRMNYAEDTGSVNTLSVFFEPPIEAYTIGLPIRVKVRETNTGSCTIDAGGGRVAIHRPTGADMSAGDLRAGGVAGLVFDGTAFQLINFGGVAAEIGEPGEPIPPEITVYTVNIPYCVDTGTVNNIVANFSPAVPSIGPGTIVMIKASNTNTGATTININGLGPRPVYAIGGTPGMPFMPSDIITGDVLIVTYDGTQFWIVPNPALNHVTTINCANNADIDLAFKALARKRIQPQAYVTIKLAPGIYTKFTTYHSDSDRIQVEGTMLAALPVMASFARTGSSAASRALDSANNIAMLRSRYASEVRITNAELATSASAITHTGPGSIVYRNLLVTGDNLAANVGTGAGVSGPQYRTAGCSFWGIGEVAIFTMNSGSVTVHNSFITSCHGSTGSSCNTGASIIFYGSGIFGCRADGLGCSTGASIYLYSDVYVQCNGNFGAMATTGGNLWLGGACVLTSNANFDAYGYGNSTLNTSASATVGNASPPVNTVGNYDSVNSAGG